MKNFLLMLFHPRQLVLYAVAALSTFGGLVVFHRLVELEGLRQQREAQEMVIPRRWCVTDDDDELVCRTKYHCASDSECEGVE